MAQRLCKRSRIQLPDRDLAYLVVEGAVEFDSYIRELRWAQQFALLNREEMMDRVVTCFEEWVGEPAERTESVNCHHNYTARERHFGKGGLAVPQGGHPCGRGCARPDPRLDGHTVVRRGRQGQQAGPRQLTARSRSSVLADEARKTFTRADLRAAMGDIEYRDTDAFLDEIPAAYKDIDVVMRDAADLVDVTHTLRQIVNVKGD